MINPDIKLKHLIYVERGIISSDFCESVIKYIEMNEWSKHTWYSTSFENDRKITVGPQTDPDIQTVTEDLQNLLKPIMKKVESKYREFNNYLEPQPITSEYSLVRMNRYEKGQSMKKHYDHTRSLFDGKHKGIPVLSYVLNFNNDYQGGNLCFWDDYIVSLGKGDVLVFPSLFLFPHSVTEIKNGTRYSGVSWSW